MGRRGTTRRASVATVLEMAIAAVALPESRRIARETRGRTPMKSRMCQMRGARSRTEACQQVHLDAVGMHDRWSKSANGGPQTAGIGGRLDRAARGAHRERGEGAGAVTEQGAVTHRGEPFAERETCDLESSSLRGGKKGPECHCRRCARVPSVTSACCECSRIDAARSRRHLSAPPRLPPGFRKRILIARREREATPR